jgi:hypothetical protein
MPKLNGVQKLLQCILSPVLEAIWMMDLQMYMELLVYLEI